MEIFKVFYFSLASSIPEGIWLVFISGSGFAAFREFLSRSMFHISAPFWEKGCNTCQTNNNQDHGCTAFGPSYEKQLATLPTQGAVQAGQVLD